MSYLEEHAPDLISSVSIMRLSPNDQLLNTLLSHAYVAFQLSTREGFEVKVSEALYAGRPVIATQAGGIPLQVQHGKNGFLIEPGDWKEAAKRLMELWTDEELHRRMSKFASASVSDEVGTVGNALSWFYLAAKWMGGEGVVGERNVIEPKERWVNDLAREEAGVPYKEGENRLPRNITPQC
jgi:glycosyltransferase involved in cell wall biosynthesis